MYDDVTQAREALCRAGRQLAEKNWTPATSGNFSLRYGNEILITRSGADKGQLRSEDILSITPRGVPQASQASQKTSAETELHMQIYDMYSRANCVLHVHSLHATVISLLRDSVELRGMELLKALPGIETHEQTIHIPVLQNSQHMPDIMREFSEVSPGEQLPAYLIRGHGMYCWGSSIDETLRIVEALDFLMQCELLLQQLAKR